MSDIGGVNRSNMNEAMSKGKSTPPSSSDPLVPEPGPKPMLAPFTLEKAVYDDTDGKWRVSNEIVQQISLRVRKDVCNRPDIKRMFARAVNLRAQLNLFRLGGELEMIVGNKAGFGDSVASDEGSAVGESIAISKNNSKAEHAFRISLDYVARPDRRAYLGLSETLTVFDTCKKTYNYRALNTLNKHTIAKDLNVFIFDDDEDGGKVRVYLRPPSQAHSDVEATVTVGAASDVVNNECHMKGYEITNPSFKQRIVDVIDANLDDHQDALLRPIHDDDEVAPEPVNIKDRPERPSTLL